MKQRLLFEGELSDLDIENVFLELIGKAIEIDDDVFLRWNGATLRIRPKDTPETLHCYDIPYFADATVTYKEALYGF